MKPIQFVHTLNPVRVTYSLEASDGITIAVTLLAAGVLLWGLAKFIEAFRPR